LSDIFNVVTSTLKTNGLDLGDDIKAPSDKQVMGLLTSLTQNESMQNLFQQLASSIKSNTDLSTTFQNLASTVLTPDAIEGMKSSLIKTAEIAKENTVNQKL
jgi:hypothetical protein